MEADTKKVGPEAQSLELNFGGRKVHFETGRIAKQANASVLVKEGDNRVLVTVVAAKEAKPGLDFFPLVVEYREKMAAGGRIPGGFLRREGKIRDAEVLSCRLIDRSLRPLFPKDFRREVQVQTTVFSAAPGGDCTSLALLGAGVALTLSDIPFDGPMLGIRSVLYRDQTTLLPVLAEREGASCDLVISVGPQGLVMVEGEAQRVPDARVLEHLLTTIDKLEAERAKVLAFRDAQGKPKSPHQSDDFDSAWKERLAASCQEKLREALTITKKQERNERVAEILAETVSRRETEDLEEAEVLATEPMFRALQKSLMRQRVTREGIRLDGRESSEIRPIWGEAGLLPRTHGSALFTRGETQALVTCTLGSDRDRQIHDTMLGQVKDAFLLHYNFPPYSVGEVRPLRGPGRREIGHGNLAHRALRVVLPEAEQFPYVIRIESEITESNGSSSMATVCGGCLALMDAGVPIQAKVAGIAMGLIEEDGEIAVLSDILGDEDHLGDMDFKVTGTADAITALQMDNKIGGLTHEVLRRALEQARAGLLHILAEMDEILGAPRKQTSTHAPQMRSIRIQPSMIGAIVGPKGKTIREIQEQSGATVSIGDDGLIQISATDGPSIQKALDRIQNIAGEVKVGEVYEGTVTGVKDFGVFVRIYDSAQGLVHISKLKGQKPGEGEKLKVRVRGVDGRGRIELELP